MAYKKIQSLDCDTVYALGGVNSETNKPNPTKMEGYYLGFRTVQIDGKDNKIHVFQTPKGNQGIWGSADTNSKLAQAQVGAMTLVEFVTKKKISGGKTKKVFDVSQDLDNTTEVSLANSESSEASDESYEDYGSEGEEEYSDDSDTEAAGNGAELAAQREANKAKVAAILGRNKSVRK